MKMDEFNRIKLKSLYNTRDLGGMPAENDMVIKDGLLYRSGRLHKLPKSTAKTLSDLGIKTIIDFRTDVERNEKPDTVIRGVNYINCPLVCTATPGITYQEKIRHTFKEEGKILYETYGTADNYMIQMYRNMVTDFESVKALKKFFNIILTVDGGVLFHCSSGKDRVGVCSAILEHLLGVNEELILKDYAVSAVFWRRKYFWYKVGIALAPATLKFKKIILCIMKTKKLYIEKTMEYLEETYGGIKEYCKKVLSLTDDDLNALKTRFLEKRAH